MKPSVSELIALLDKPALLKWANKIGLQGIEIDNYRTQKKRAGIDYHKSVENYLLHGELSDYETFNEKMVKFFSDKQIIGVEQKIEHEHFVGRYDVKFGFDDLVFVGDFKSKVKRVYFENKIQLAAYSICENTYSCLIALPEFVLVPVELDLGLYEELLIALSKVYSLKKQLA